MNNKKTFLILIVSQFALGIAYSELLGINNTIMESLIDNFSQSQIEEYLHSKEKWKWLGYIVVIIFLLLKVTIIASIIDIGCFFFGKEIKYKKLFNIVVKAEFVFLLVIVFKTTWFYFFQTEYNLEDLQYLYPLSALNIIGYEDLQPWFVYPFQVINLFELFYWVLLSYFIDKELNTDITKNTGLKIVASSYGVSLLIWVVGIMFFTLNMS